jgi:prepilin-type N-terminal cleavage/methylation domain-containing protein
MRKTRTDAARHGWTLIELVVAIGLMALLAGLATDVLFEYRQSRNEVLQREALAWAASAQWERIVAGAPADLPPPEGVLPEGVSLHAQTQPGEGQWKGLTRVTVTATATVWRGKELREQVSGFIPTGGKQ